MNKPGKRVLVGMSGGIDSTATCLMLREQGYEIIGLTMWVWGDEPVEARNLADSMGIEHHVADEREAFRQIIVQNFIDEYRRGRTPNPCVMCNPLFKFRILTEWADRLGCAFIATGHYTRLEERNGKVYIIAGDDDKKDQSYTMFSAFSTEKVADGFEYQWVRFFCFNRQREEWLQPGVKIDAKGEMGLTVHNGKPNVSCRVEELTQCVADSSNSNQ